MKRSLFSSHTRDQLKLSFVSLAVIWSVVIVLVMVVVQSLNSHTIHDLLEAQARGAYNKDLVYRRWSSMHGGVYVPTDSMTPPNPFLAHIPDRDIVLDDGTELTLMNPAYMTRQVHELGLEQYGERGHITSLNPIRPENAPDEWETVVLEKMENHGIVEIYEVSEINGEPFMRYMHAMNTEETCLKCHAAQGYQVGDLRGGISVSVPFSKMQPLFEKRSRQVYGSFSFIWLLGMAGLFGSYRALNRRMVEAAVIHSDLTRNEALLREVQEAALIGHFEIDMATTNWRSSPSLDRLLGVEKADPTAWRSMREALSYIHPDDRKGLHRDFVNHVRSGNTSYNRVIRIFRQSDGQIRWIRGIGTIRTHETGLRNVIIGTIQDIHAEETARREHERLRGKMEHNQRLESIGQLAGGVAHDFNNMLGVILGNIELTRDWSKDNSEVDAQLEEAEQAARRSAELTTQLLAFSRMQPSQPMRVNSDRHIESSLRMVRRMMGANVAVQWLPAANGANVLLDPSQFDQVLMNLVLNARDAMKDGGTITVSTRCCTQLDSFFDPEKSDNHACDYVQISVEDEGVGMDEATLLHIFEPFYTTKQLGHGTGLGLATVYGIIKQSNGHIMVDSTPGKGSRFDIYFPILEDADSPKNLTGDQEVEHAGNAQSILVVEDEEMVSNMTRRVLEKGGYTVQVANHADKALRLVREEGLTPSLMITDIVMPGKNGVELAEEMNSLVSDLPVLFISGHDRNILEGRRIEHFLPKPFTTTALLKTVHDILSDN